MQKHIDSFTPYALGSLRIVTGYMMIFHGLDKVFGTFSGKAVPLTSLIGVRGIIELVFGFLVLIGLATRLVAFILSGQMAVAYFIFHGLVGNVFLPYVNKGELAALYAFVFFFLSLQEAEHWE
ncbi:DoxX family protein [Streptococcus uberis]|uniref:DoxX family protein n=1 Tax=Streptococcus uberis TaxID=1349 RepID=UPI000DFE7CB7|nr:DoxX family protein [Streptococcus uberis]SUO89887.1 DoxX family protein [Streptococcus uberis]